MTAARALEVVATGPQALVQDLGRAGLAAVGVPRSGAADRAALRLANRLVANPEDAAGVEALLGGLVLRARGSLVVAVTGAPCPGVPLGAPVPLPDGAMLRLGPPSVGLRSYVAVRGGVAVDPVLGSRSTDVLSGLGPPGLTAGDVLPVGPSPSAQPAVDLAPSRTPQSGDVVVRAVPGPRDDWVVDASALAGIRWTASSSSDRVGLRLEGPPLPRGGPPGAPSELPSEGTVRGAVQVPPDGQPVVLLADAPVTGGYPVVAVVVDTDVDRLAQVRPGQTVRVRLLPRPPWADAAGEAAPRRD